MTTRRMKTYTGGQGFVYQYYFVGKRSAVAPQEGQDRDTPATEFIFDVTSDRKIMFAVSIFLNDKAVQTWAASHGRDLSDAEKYAAVKMRLFQAFDEIEDMVAEGRRLPIHGEVLEQLLSTLGVQ
ncbi:MAG: hypothetical protein JOY93_12230 [Acidobacteriales bacterium]|nr:hypothetical protein [Terriglobales bacterium]